MSNLTVLFSFLLAVVAFGSFSSIIVWTIKNGISPMPSSAKAKKCLIEFLPKSSKSMIYELGSGWGTLLIPLARHYPHCKIIGIESSPLPFFISKLRLACEGAPQVHVRLEDFFLASLKDASLVVCYLYPSAMHRLKKKFIEELQSGTVIISNTFAIPGWTPEQEIPVNDLYKSKIYIYKIP